MTRYATGRERPWKARAWQVTPDWTMPTGVRRELKGQAAAKSREGLSGFIARHRDQGREVQVWQDPPLPLEDQ